MKEKLKFMKKIVKRILPRPVLSIIRTYRCYNAAKQRLKKKDLLWFGVHVTDHCNLNCKYCDNFSPIADEFYLDIKQFTKDCERIAVLSNGKIAGIGLRGGEPLLHPELEKIIEVSRINFPDARIEILTNGILLPRMHKSFWDCCKRGNIIIHLTKYPIDVDFGAIERLIHEKMVNMFYSGNTKTELKQMSCIPLDTAGGQKAKDSFIRCYKSNFCTNLTNGKIYPCDTIPNIKHFNKYFGKNIEVSKNDYIDIYTTNTIDAIFNFLITPVPFCRYCNLKQKRNNLLWSISKKELSEWM